MCFPSLSRAGGMDPRSSRSWWESRWSKALKEETLNEETLKEKDRHFHDRDEQMYLFEFALKLTNVWNWTKREKKKEEDKEAI